LAIAQRRQLDRNHIKAVVEVLPEITEGFASVSFIGFMGFSSASGLGFVDRSLIDLCLALMQVRSQPWRFPYLSGIHVLARGTNEALLGFVPRREIEVLG
jgi:hypothetical protein